MRASLSNPRTAVKSVTIIGNSMPRQCGIATFTTDLANAISAELDGNDCWGIAMNDIPEGYVYPDRIRFEINQNEIKETLINSPVIFCDNSTIQKPL